eukprot:CAMPEP_0168463282 /NCGR_PEP_ID=MMETSP0228-20121227/54974_1 /TAXON_ID=133427 /ORGANISM="Protoceratium reticulatum, Strain CCCM 535 (=CCMP 1889)" /LENGTH=69 /DNA_ID=CAMNT_0008478731 /DNA_START=49 /DNA_END=255 /DNA_ORIENTATION=+
MNNVLKRQLGEGRLDEYQRARSSDAGLSPAGREQVRRVVQHPALVRLFSQSQPPVDVYCSPLRRAIETA